MHNILPFRRRGISPWRFDSRMHRYMCSAFRKRAVDIWFGIEHMTAREHSNAPWNAQDCKTFLELLPGSEGKLVKVYFGAC